MEKRDIPEHMELVKQFFIGDKDWPSKDGRPCKLAVSELSLEFQFWNKFITCRLHPYSNPTEFPVSSQLLLFEIYGPEDINVGSIIWYMIQSAAIDSRRRPVGFPCLITSLCHVLGVQEFPYDELKPPTAPFRMKSLRGPYSASASSSSQPRPPSPPLRQSSPIPAPFTSAARPDTTDPDMEFPPFPALGLASIHMDSLQQRECLRHHMLDQRALTRRLFEHFGLDVAEVDDAYCVPERPFTYEYTGYPMDQLDDQFSRFGMGGPSTQAGEADVDDDVDDDTAAPDVADDGDDMAD